jgi:hypothetical protein
MGIVIHKTLVVTSFSKDHLASAVKMAQSCHLADLCALPPIESRVNGYWSFSVMSSGSKEGWDESDLFDAEMETLILYLNGYRYSDGSSPLSWVYVQFGDEAEEPPKVLRHSGEIEVSDDYKGPANAEWIGA